MRLSRHLFGLFVVLTGCATDTTDLKDRLSELEADVATLSSGSVDDIQEVLNQVSSLREDLSALQPYVAWVVVAVETNTDGVASAATGLE